MGEDFFFILFLQFFLFDLLISFLREGEREGEEKAN